MTRAVWLNGEKLCMDQHLLAGILSDLGCYSVGVDRLADDGTLGDLSDRGCILIVPARYWTAEQIQPVIDSLPWVVVMLTSDEEATFAAAALEHPAMRLWVMEPRPGIHPPGVRYLGVGRGDDAAEALRCEMPAKPTDVSFAGQITHPRREAMAGALGELGDHLSVEFHPTEGFMAGMPPSQYMAQLARTKVVPCPSGPTTPDTFRLYEALEAGAVPIADGRCLTYDADGYWHLVYPQGVPFPIVTDWTTELAKNVEAILAAWPASASRAQAWWLQQKRAIAQRLAADVAELSGEPATGEQITVIIPTSPTPSPPEVALERIRIVIESVRERLPDADVLVMADGVRAEQEHLRASYEQYLQLLVWACAHEWTGVTPWIFDHHGHQANTTRAALEQVTTPLILFVEHDTPLVGEIPFGQLGDLIRSGFANMVRLHHEAQVLTPHRHLMLDPKPVVRSGVPVMRTVQWSQRPHLAGAGFYRSLLATYFGAESRTMIEDLMHGVVQDAWRRHGEAGWEQFRLVMFTPDGSMKRSEHLDGRGDEPKFEMVFAYEGDRPAGAPPAST